jgi:integrase
MAKKRDGLFKRGGIWHMRTDPITGKQRSTECRDLAAAREVRASRERAAANPSHATQSAATLSGECRRMIDARAALGKATSFYEQKLGHWCRVLGDRFPLSNFGPAQVDHFVAQRRAEGASDHTITKEFRCLATALRLSKRSGSYAGELAVLRPMGLTAGYVPRTRALSPSELVALLAELPPERWAFVALIVGLGLRRGEAIALTPEHVDLQLGVVRVPGTKTAGAKRDVPVLGPFLGIVTKAAAALPLAPWGNYLRDLRIACKRAGIETVTANDLRRTHATLLRQAGVERDVVRRLLGHSSGSVMLETVYDQPKPLELAARAGELASFGLLEVEGDATMTRQCELGPMVASCENIERARKDSNLRPTAPEAQSPGEQERGDSYSIAESERSDDCGEPPRQAAEHTTTRHSWAALALGFAAEGVFARAALRGVA